MLVVITPAVTHNLTTKETVKAELGIAGSSEDTLIDRLIAEASAAINSYCRRPTFGLEVVRQTEYLTIYGSRVFLNRDLVPTITGVALSGVSLTAPEYELDGSELCRLDTSGNRKLWDIGKLVIDYSAGYSLLGGLPRDIERVCLDTVREFYHDKDRDSKLRSEKILDIIDRGYSTSSSASATPLPASAMEKLQPYQDWVVV